MESSGPHRVHVGTGRSLAAGAIFVAMLVAALSLWTLIPLAWVFIASKISTTQFPDEGPYAIVIVGIAVTVLLDSWLIGKLNELYVQVTGSNKMVSMRPSWLRSMRDAAPRINATTVVEAVLISSVMLAALAFAVWFFFLAGSPLPDQ